jgi:hypothetical protein
MKLSEFVMGIGDHGEPAEEIDCSCPVLFVTGDATRSQLVYESNKARLTNILEAMCRRGHVSL